MRLINADGLIADFMKIAITRSLTHKKDRMTFAKIKETINQQPPVDARLVVHGKWIPTRKDSDISFCSNCESYWIIRDDAYDYLYCPKCGADMRGENNEQIH